MTKTRIFLTDGILSARFRISVTWHFHDFKRKPLNTNNSFEDGMKSMYVNALLKK